MCLKYSLFGVFFPKILASLVSFEVVKKELTAAPKKTPGLIILRTNLMVTQKNPKGTINLCDIQQQNSRTLPCTVSCDTLKMKGLNVVEQKSS